MMDIPTVKITGQLLKSDNSVLANANIYIKLMIPEGYNYLICESTPSYLIGTENILAITDEEGNIKNSDGNDLELIPNSILNPVNSYYLICIMDGDYIFAITRWKLENQDCDVGEIPYS